jgi:nicotinamide-nucleotide amidase
VRRKLVVETTACCWRRGAPGVGQVGIVILTGGLGPTPTTLPAMPWRRRWGASWSSVRIFDTLTARFERLNRKMADNNRRQTFLVEGAEPLPNPGTAPGQWPMWKGGS